MTTTTRAGIDMPLIKRMRASKLPPPAQRLKIRTDAGLSREDIARELRAQGIRVTEGAVKWWELERSAGGFDPRPAKAIAYRQLLERIQREVESWQTAVADGPPK